MATLQAHEVISRGVAVNTPVTLYLNKTPRQGVIVKVKILEKVARSLHDDFTLSLG